MMGTLLLWLLLTQVPAQDCYQAGMWLTGCPKHVLGLSVCEQKLHNLCALGRGPVAWPGQPPGGPLPPPAP